MVSALSFVALTLAAIGGDRSSAALDGELTRGERFERSFGPGFTLVLDPIQYGWEIKVLDDRPTENIARLIPPFHFVPNPRYIEGWHFRNADNSGPNDGTINAPQEERLFVFSPDVGRTINYPPTPEQVEILGQSGRGRLVITSLQLGDLEVGEKAVIEKMTFRIEVSWPAEWSKKLLKK